MEVSMEHDFYLGEDAHELWTEAIMPNFGYLLRCQIIADLSTAPDRGAVVFLFFCGFLLKFKKDIFDISSFLKYNRVKLFTM
jgi:hypothetical protein